jgi:glycosyltransferase involved in cell wall biosynthesis
MSQQVPTISVGMPVYNGMPYLPQAIESVLAQSFGDFELIISDNCSTDGTQAVCEAFAKQDARIVYIRNTSNIGAARNYNQLFERARGRYFRWFNSDDLASPVLHERCLALLESRPDVVLAYGKTDIIDSAGRLIERYEDRLDLQQASVSERFLQFQRVVGQTNAIYGLMRREALANTQLMGSGAYPAADTYLMGELVLQGKFAEIPEPLFSRRMHESASSWNRADNTVQQSFWTGSDARFVMPTVKQCATLWTAIGRGSFPWSQQWPMRWYVIKRLFWSRRELLAETVQAIRRPRTKVPRVGAQP